MLFERIEIAHRRRARDGRVQTDVVERDHLAGIRRRPVRGRSEPVAVAAKKPDQGFTVGESVHRIADQQPHAVCRVTCVRIRHPTHDISRMCDPNAQTLPILGPAGGRWLSG